jgi:AAA domain/FaeA-like protein
MTAADDVVRVRALAAADRHRLNSSEEPEPDVLAEMRNGTWLDAQNFPPLQWTVPGIIPEGFGLLVAPPKAGKSWLAADIGLASAAGGVALNRLRVGQRPVLYLALEDGHRRLQDRFRKIMANQALPEHINVIIHAQTHEVIPMIDGFLEHQQGAALVILDTLGKVKPPKASYEDSYSSDYRIGSRLKQAVDSSPGSTLLVVHHSRKAESADFVDNVSGTQGIAGSADFVLVLSRKRHADDAVLAVTGRDIAECEYGLTTNGGLWSLDGSTLSEAARSVENRREQKQLGDRALDVLGLVTQQRETKASDVAEKLGIDQHQARTYLSRLADSGRIRKMGRGVYGAVASVASVANTDENTTHATDATPSCTSCGGELTTNNQTGRCAECRFDARQLTAADEPDGLVEEEETK